MPRIAGISHGRASAFTRLFYWAVQRKVGRVSDMWKIAAHVPSLLWIRGIFELLLDRSNLVERRIRKLAELKAATLVGCPV